VSPSDAFEFGPFRLDASTRVLWRGNEIVPLPPKSLELLVVLVEHQGDVVPKQDLMRRVWPDTFVEEANLSVNVSALRKALGEREDGQPYIQTISRRGYRFVAPPRKAVGGLPTLAVLPFQPLGPAPAEDEYLGVGMADALITRLGSTGRVVVRPTGSVLRFAGAGVDPLEAGRRLQVDGVLDGKMQRQADRLRVTVQLVPLGPELPAWAETFDEDLSDIFAVQDAIAERVAGVLALRLEASERKHLSRRDTTDVVAYQAYVKGRYFWNRFTGPSLEKAFVCFQEAAERDPGYALPHAGLADCYVILGFSGLAPPNQAWPLAGEEARRALALDESVAEAHISLGYVSLFQNWDWEVAGRELERARALSPNSPAAHQWYALYLDLLGRFEEATHEVERARALDPVSLIVNTMMGLQLHLAGDCDGELEQMRRTVELDPGQFLGHWGLGLALQHKGRPEEALGEHRLALEQLGGSALMKAVLARSLAVSGRADEARAALAEIEASGYLSPYQRATVHVALGERDAALACLERAAEDRDPWLVWVKVDPMLDALRGDSRFGGVLALVFPGGSAQ
jgi:DNA-binding winged helix-turn-helix (wHTH) protein/tetratricopeptide (TPR) repeat protein